MITPIPYIGTGGQSQTALGHYMVAHRSGEIAATLAAAGHLARIRWAPASSTLLAVLTKLRAGVTISAAITTAVELALRAIIARQFTTDFTTAMTAINLATTAKTNVMRSGFMQNSQMGANGPGICTTVVLSGQTLTADAAPFCMCSFANPSSTLGASAVTNQVGAGVPMQDLYNWVGQGGHPPVLSNNEGILVQNHLAGPGSGTFGLYVEWSWAECLVF